MMKNEERRNEAEVRRQNLLVTAIEIEDDRQVLRQKLQDIGKDCVTDFFYVDFSVLRTFLLYNIWCLLILKPILFNLQIFRNATLLIPTYSYMYIVYV